jgi:hypothetical protein
MVFGLFRWVFRDFLAVFKNQSVAPLPGRGKLERSEE